MNTTLTREEHIAKLKELIKQTESEIYTVKGKPGRHDQELVLLRQEKEFLEHEVEKLSWLDEPSTPQAPIVNATDQEGDGPTGDDKQPVLV